MIDNYDSFTYNLVQYLAELGAMPTVLRNDETDVEAIRALAPAAIVISPGPGRPEDAGICVEVVRRLGPTVPLLGVCLGHQAIGVAFGAQVDLAPELMHGKTSEIRHDGGALYAGVPNPFTATRYHSLCVRSEGLPGVLAVTATSPDGVIMGLRHRTHPIEGVQFHPESILSVHGKRILANFLASAPESRTGGATSEGGGPDAGDPGATRRGA